MGKHRRLRRAHVAGEFLDIRQHDFLVPHRDGAKLLLILVMFADGIDEGAAIETFLAKPILQPSFLSALPPPDSTASMNQSRHCLPSVSSTTCTRLVFDPNSL